MRTALTRRQLVRGGVAASTMGAGILAGVARAAQAQTDADLVTTLLGTETLAVFVYAHLVHTAALTGERERLARRLLAHERAHVKALSAALDRLHAKPPPPLSNVTDADQLLAASKIPGSLTQVKSSDDAVRLLVRLEVALERGYYVAMSTLEDTELQHTAAQILATEAQHSTALVNLLFPGDVDKAVPEPYVEGNPGDGRI